MTYYTSLSYTNYTLVTDWYVAGNEIADHTYVLIPSPFGFPSRRERARITFRYRPMRPETPNVCSTSLTRGFVIFCRMTHVGSPPIEEINGNLITLNALAGIPLTAIKGFRAPYLNFTADTLKHLYKSEFTYDSSASASIPVTEEYTDAFWPYTLDNGLANNCLSAPGVCKGEPKLPGFWEIPMYAFFDNRGTSGPHLMDPWL